MRLTRNEQLRAKSGAHAARGERLRLATSLLVATLAYLGLIFGGNFVVNVSRGLNALSSAESKELPQQLTARDGLRAIVASERKHAGKSLDQEPAPALPAKAPAVLLFAHTGSSAGRAPEPLLIARAPSSYASRAPPGIV